MNSSARALNVEYAIFYFEFTKRDRGKNSSEFMNSRFVERMNMKQREKRPNETFMVEVAHSIDLNLSENLREREYRQKFFLAESSAEIATQLIALRKRRDVNQQELAQLIDTKQPAISRIEKAEYQSWSLSVLRKIADVLDARIRVLIQPSEDILGEYKDGYEVASETSSEIAALKEILRSTSSAIAPPAESATSRHSLATSGGVEGGAAYYPPIPVSRKKSEMPKLTDPEHSAATA